MYSVRFRTLREIKRGMLVYLFMSSSFACFGIRTEGIRKNIPDAGDPV